MEKMCGECLKEKELVSTKKNASTPLLNRVKNSKALKKHVIVAFLVALPLHVSDIRSGNTPHNLPSII